MLEKSKNIVALILAAGESKRLGTPKQNLIFNNNTLLNHIRQHLNANIVDRTFIVLGAYAFEIQETSGLDDSEIIYFEGWQEGMGSSLAFACSKILKNEKYDGILITLGDLPLVDNLDYRKMVELFEGESSVVATMANNTLGVPAILGSKYFKELMQLSGEKGAKPIIHKYIDIVKVFENEKAAFDLDTLDDIQFLSL